MSLSGRARRAIRLSESNISPTTNSMISEASASSARKPRRSEKPRSSGPGKRHSGRPISLPSEHGAPPKPCRSNYLDTGNRDVHGTRHNPRKSEMSVKAELHRAEEFRVGAL